MPESNPETHVIDFRAAEQLLDARDPRGAVKLLDSVIAAHPENTAARLLRARAFFASAQLRPAELEFELVLEREPDNAFAHYALARTFPAGGPPGSGDAPLPARGRARPEAGVPEGGQVRRRRLSFRRSPPITAVSYGPPGRASATGGARPGRVRTAARPGPAGSAPPDACGT